MEGSSTAALLVGVAVTTAFVAGGARRLGLPAPLVLVLVGAAGSLAPWVPDVRLDPDVVLVGVLPPLLYATAIRTSLVDFRADRHAIGLLSVGAVLVTAAAVGLAVALVLPVPPRRPSPSAPSSHPRTRWRPRPSPAGSACRGGW